METEDCFEEQRGEFWEKKNPVQKDDESFPGGF
jgi:hypothetical protein